jgi:hypothetical protein
MVILFSSMLIRLLSVLRTSDLSALATTSKDTPIRKVDSTELSQGSWLREETSQEVTALVALQSMELSSPMRTSR